MARPLRIEYAGALPHLPSRNEGIRGQLISTLHLRHVYTQAEIGQTASLHSSTRRSVGSWPDKSMQEIRPESIPSPQRRRGID
jgi:hypothetical protein